MCFESCLFSRWQYLSFHGCLSEWGAVSMRVIQDSIPGLLHFSIYVNYLSTVVKYSQYADDTELYLCGHDLLSIQYALQCDLDAIQAWLYVNLLQLNVSNYKSIVMLIGTRQRI